MVGKHEYTTEDVPDLLRFHILHWLEDFRYFKCHLKNIQFVCILFNFKPNKLILKRVRSTSFPSDDTTIHISEILPHLLEEIFAWISSVIFCVGFSIRLLKFSLLSLLLTSHQNLNSSHEKLYPSRRYLFTLLPTHCLVNYSC